jgi:hypothetical protein
MLLYKIFFNGFNSLISFIEKTKKKKMYFFFSVPVSILLIINSPIIFLYFDTVSVIFFLFSRIKLRYLFLIHIFYFLIWGCLFSYYSYLLVNEPTIPINSGDSFLLTDEIVAVLMYFSARLPSMARTTFIETLMILHALHFILGFYIPIYFFWIIRGWFVI